VPEGGEPSELEIALLSSVQEKIASLTENLEALEYRKAAQDLRALWVTGNEYLQVAAPWTAIKTDRDRASVVVRTAINLVALYARLSAPFIPFSAAIIAEAVGEAGVTTWPLASDASLLDSLPRGRTVRAPEVLFKKIEDDQVAEWKEQFGGVEG